MFGSQPVHARYGKNNSTTDDKKAIKKTDVTTAVRQRYFTSMARPPITIITPHVDGLPSGDKSCAITVTRSPGPALIYPIHR